VAEGRESRKMTKGKERGGITLPPPSIPVSTTASLKFAFRASAGQAG